MATIMTRADYFNDTEYFCRYNNNPMRTEAKSWNRGDCVVRAMAYVMNISWQDAYTLLCAKGAEMYEVPNGQMVYEAVLKEQGYIKVSCPAVKGKKRITVEDFCKKNMKGRYFLSVAHHVTAVEKGVCYDVWNPANKVVYSYWMKKSV